MTLYGCFIAAFDRAFAKHGFVCRLPQGVDLEDCLAKT